jgi:hypothetical protein
MGGKKIAMIGAGSMAFCKMLMSEITATHLRKIAHASGMRPFGQEFRRRKISTGPSWRQARIWGCFTPARTIAGLRRPVSYVGMIFSKD